MKELMTDDLAQNYSWSGQSRGPNHKTRKFSILKICKILTSMFPIYFIKIYLHKDIYFNKMHINTFQKRFQEVVNHTPRMTAKKLL